MWQPDPNYRTDNMDEIKAALYTSYSYREEPTPNPWGGEFPMWSWVEKAEQIEQAENERKASEQMVERIRKALAPHFEVSSLHEVIEKQTTDHLLALDTSLEEAIGKVTRDNRWKSEKVNDGGKGWYMQDSKSDFYTQCSNPKVSRPFIEMATAFLNGDILTALQLRDDVREHTCPTGV